MSTPDALLAGRYRLLRRIGTGGMGVVWEARDERLDRIVAVKELRPRQDLSAGEAERANARAMREARITASLEHPYAVSVFDVVDHEGRTCLIMQHVPSQPLSTLIRGLDALSPEETARVGSQVASALAAAHRLGIVHRDVKPGNVLIADDGTARISDFGISHALDDLSPAPPGMVHGTPAFLAPEVVRGGRYTFASDVYGLGATLYAAVEGVPPFGSEQNPVALLAKVSTGQFPPPVRAAQLTPLLLRMLATDPADRPTMSEAARLLAELDGHDGRVARPVTAAGSTRAGAAVTQHGVDPGRDRTGPPPGARRRTRRALALTAVLTGLVVLGVVLASLQPNLDRERGRAGGAPQASATPGVYASLNFAVPFQLAAPTWVAPTPRTDEQDLVTWQTADVAIRFLVPVEVYPAGDQRPSSAPRDYLSYLLSQSAEGARFTDRSLTTVGGRPATLITATSKRRLAGVIGCPRAGMPQPRCYGLRPERRLRIAVVELEDRALLIWLRNDRRSRFQQEKVLFEQTLKTVRFR